MDFPGGETIPPGKELKVLVDIDGRQKALLTLCFEDPEEEEWCLETILERGEKTKKITLEKEFD